MSLSDEENRFVDDALRFYDENLREQLEATHLGELIALAPATGEYVVGRKLLELNDAKRKQLGDQQVYIFRIGGGGAIRRGKTVHIGVNHNWLDAGG